MPRVSKKPKKHKPGKLAKKKEGSMTVARKFKEENDEGDSFPLIRNKNPRDLYVRIDRYTVHRYYLDDNSERVIQHLLYPSNYCVDTDIKMIKNEGPNDPWETYLLESYERLINEGKANPRYKVLFDPRKRRIELKVRESKTRPERIELKVKRKPGRIELKVKKRPERIQLKTKSKRVQLKVRG